MMQLSLLSGGAADGLVKALAPEFEAETGAGVRGLFGAVGLMREKLRAGHPADLVILTRPIIDDLARLGEVAPETIADIGMVRTAIAVRTGSERPAVETADRLRAALLDADEIHFPDPALATAGIHLAKVLGRLGIAEEVAGALRIHSNGATAMQALATSGARNPIGCTQVTEILITAGVVLVGPLPDRLGLQTVYTAAVCKWAREAGLAHRFVTKLAGPGAAGQRRLSGFE